MPAMFGTNILNEAFEFTDGGERDSFICLVSQVYPYFATVLYFPMMTSYSTFPLKSHFFFYIYRNRAVLGILLYIQGANVKGKETTRSLII